MPLERYHLQASHSIQMKSNNSAKRKLADAGMDDLTYHCSNVAHENSELFPSDTEMVTSSIAKMSQKLHGLIFLHQIYATLSNRTIVDSELSSMRYTAKSYKFIQCCFVRKGEKNINGTSGNTNTMAIISANEYISSMSKYLANRAPSSSSSNAADDSSGDSALCRKFAKWITSSTQISLFRSDLLNYRCNLDGTTNTDGSEKNESLTEEEVDRLLQAGFLTYRNNVDSIYSSSSSNCNNTCDSSLANGSHLFQSDVEFTCSSTGGKGGEVYWLSHPAVR